MAKDHRTKRKDDFCAVAAEGTCGCSIDKSYVQECKPIPGWDDTIDFTWKNKRTGKRQQGAAPHHIVCVASVGTLIIDASGKKVDGIVRATEWCVNTKKNMVAMPLWGHTVQWYCNIATQTLKASTRKAPPFEDIPQHDWDHTGTGAYQQELEELIIKIVKNMRQAGHDAKTSDLAGSLDDLSDDFRELLVNRGKRGTPKGTHKGWINGNANPKSKWYLPFSMANDAAASRKGFPKLTFTNKVFAKLKWLAEQLK